MDTPLNFAALPNNPGTLANLLAVARLWNDAALTAQLMSVLTPRMAAAIKPLVDQDYVSLTDLAVRGADCAQYYAAYYLAIQADVADAATTTRFAA
jgi:hypothetical protein